MGEAHRTSEARMRAAAQAMVTALDEHGERLTRVEAVTVLGTVLGTYALAWGGEAQVVGGAARVARALVEKRRALPQPDLADEDAVLFAFHRAVGDLPPSPALVEEWTARHPEHAEAIRERAVDILDFQAFAAADAASALHPPDASSGH